MTPFGLAALFGGGGSLALGLGLDWPAFDLVGLGLLMAVVLAFAAVARPSSVTIDREIQPPRVPKGQPAIALLTFVNRSRRAVPATVATQHFSAQEVRTVIPRLRGRERGTRAYRLPTTRRGIFDVEPVEIVRRDPFELFRLTHRQAEPQRIWVYPRVLDFTRLPTGQSRLIEGPSSDTSPQGTITFHRLREYVPGDDLRLVHWRSSAHAGQLLVKHNVDTAQPYTVVVFDLRPSRYTETSFEEAVDVTASVIVSAGRNKAPAELRLHRRRGGRRPAVARRDPADRLPDRCRGHAERHPAGATARPARRRAAARNSWSSSPARWSARTCPPWLPCDVASTSSSSCRSTASTANPSTSPACG